MAEYVPAGVKFSDGTHGEVVLAIEAPWRGWLLHEVQGVWVCLRRATAEDVAVVKSLVLPVLHELAIQLGAGESC